MRIISVILILVVVLLGIVFAVLNATAVTFNYYVGKATVSLSLLLAMTLGLGILLGILVELKPLIRLKWQNHTLKSKLKETEEELTRLRHMPIKDGSLC